MRTRNVNGKTAGGETAGRYDQNLTDSQILDLFDWVVSAACDEQQPEVFIVPPGAVELNVFVECAPDYYAVWLLKNIPVAAALPLDNFYRLLPS
ncbi:TPA: hypothetical protein OW286_003588 [Citrobacter freundii]|nr:hypothetical protein [Citrobacter freundii]